MKTISPRPLFTFSPVSVATLLFLFFLAACVPVTQPPATSTTVPASTSSPTATSTLIPVTAPPETTFYESETYGFRLKIPAGFQVQEQAHREGIILALGFIPGLEVFRYPPELGNIPTPDATTVAQLDPPLGLFIYEKPEEMPLLDWFALHVGSVTMTGQPKSDEVFFADPIIQNQDNYKGNPALQFESGARPVPYQTVVDRGAWAFGVYYLRDYPFDFEATYAQILASLEFFEPSAQTAATSPTARPPTATPTVCLDETAQPRALPPRETPLEVQFISDGNVWTWEETSAVARQITDTGDARQFSFSPDGEVVVIERQMGNLHDEDYTDDYHVELWAINLDGSNLRQLVSVAQFDSFFAAPEEAWAANAPEGFAWIPGTHQLIFGVYPIINALGAGYGTIGYWKVDVDTLKIEPTEQPAEFQYAGFISPDGTQKALYDTTSLSLVNTDGTQLRENVFTFFSSPAEEGGGSYLPNFYWALDSQSLLALTFTEDLYSEKATFTTWQIPINGSPVQELHTFWGLPFWANLSPNQHYLAYLKRNEPYSNDYEFHLATFDGSKDLLYTALYNAQFLTWHPDSYHFVYDQFNVLRPMLGSVCGGGIPLLDTADTPATQLQWVDATRFLFVKGSLDSYAGPRELRLGQIGGPSILIGPFNGDYAYYLFNVEQAPLGRE